MNQHTFQEIPEIPLHLQKDHKPHIDLITMAINWAREHKAAPDYITDPGAAFIIYLSFLISETKPWIHAFNVAQRNASNFYRNPDTYWIAIEIGVSTPNVEKVCLELHPNLDREKYFPNTRATPEPEKTTPHATLKIKPSLPRPREESIIHFIDNHAPSINYPRVFILMSRHTKNRFSCRGRKVYPYGQKYLALKLGIPLRTVERIFSWLRRHGTIFKRSNENPELHRSATWFICTSWKQSTYFRDPEARRPKKGSPGSRRTRHFPSVPT